MCQLRGYAHCEKGYFNWRNDRVPFQQASRLETGETEQCSWSNCLQECVRTSTTLPSRGVLQRDATGATNVEAHSTASGRPCLTLSRMLVTWCHASNGFPSNARKLAS